jgi:hypothetical protein
MRRFLIKMTWRTLFMLVVVMGVFSFRWSDAYYYHIPEGTTYSKIPWINRQMEASRVNDQTVLFVGSSICKGGVNDSLLNAWDSTSTQFLNFGVSHSCNAITEELLEELIVRRHQKPKHVYLCLKSDARPTSIHNMYPVIAEPQAILNTFTEANIKAPLCVFKKASWNLNYLSRSYKFDNSYAPFIHTSEYGYELYKDADSSEVEKLYRDNKKAVQSMIEFMRTTKGRHAPGGILRKLSNMKMDYLDNMIFQDEKFEACAALLEREGIPFDVILYPNLIVQREGQEQVLAAYYKQLYSAIDFTKHEVIIAIHPELARSIYWQDMNHLNKRGAALYSDALFKSINQQH